jgi:hypothetical protein
MSKARVLHSAWLALVFVTSAGAATYNVGPTRTYADLPTLFTQVDLQGGDLVLIDGNTTYAGGIVMRDTDSGTPGNPVVLRGVAPSGGTRPLLLGGANTIEFRSANHVVLENVDIAGTGDTVSGTFRCLYHHSHDLTVRNVLIRDCPRHGILGADTDSGSLTVEYSEIRNSGSNQSQHAIYMSTDQIAYPGSVFRLQHSYVHDSRFDDTRDGGNLIKSRAERNEIYYNYLRGAWFHELELIGPDPAGVNAQWTQATAREDSDVVGNVIVHTGDFSSMIRIGGDGTSGTGHSLGRYRFVNNTLIHYGNTATATAVIFRTHFGIESLQAHNNVMWRDAGALRIWREESPTNWVTGSAQIAGSNNWIPSSASVVPVGFSGTLSGATPPFINTATLAALDLRPAAGSALINAGAPSPSSGAAYAIASPLFPPVREPSLIAIAANAPMRASDAQIDIGAFEVGALEPRFANGFED